jgi:hypothetical protein
MCIQISAFSVVMVKTLHSRLRRSFKQAPSEWAFHCVQPSRDIVLAVKT